MNLTGKIEMEKLILILGLVLVINVNAQDADFPKLTGPYLGQKPPGLIPEIFAPGIVSTKSDEYALEISTAGNEILYSKNGKLILMTRKSDGSWNEPAVAPFSGKYIDGESCFSPDGNKIYFCSRRPAPNSKFIRNVWISEKSNGSWGKAFYLGNLVCSKEIHAPSVAVNGNIYDDGIVRFEYINGEYRPAEKIKQLEGEFPFIAPDESYIIFAKRIPGKYDSDLYISFQKPDGDWSASISLGENVNSPNNEGNSFVTADGKYIFFSRNLDIYWTDAKIIEELKSNVLK